MEGGLEQLGVVDARVQHRVGRLCYLRGRVVCSSRAWRVSSIQHMHQGMGSARMHEPPRRVVQNEQACMQSSLWGLTSRRRACRGFLPDGLASGGGQLQGDARRHILSHLSCQAVSCHEGDPSPLGHSAAAPACTVHCVGEEVDHAQPHHHCHQDPCGCMQVEVKDGALMQATSHNFKI